MRYVKQVSQSVRWLITGAFAISTAFAVGCQGEVGGGMDMSGSDTGGTNSGSATATTTGSTATGTTAGTTTGSTATTATGGTTATSTTGTTGTTTGVVILPPDPNPCTGAADSRLVVAPQRILRLTMQEIVNSVKSLVDMTEATALVTSGSFGNIGAETDLAFPPLDANREGVQIDDAKFMTLDNMAQNIAAYVGNATNFTTLTKCPATPTDACATTYLNAFAQKAYRHPLATAEQTRLTNLYNSFKSTVVNGWTVTNTIPEAVQNSVYAIMSTPQLLYRSEIGDATKKSTSPPGVPLTPYEMATQLAFVLTDNPPDAPLLAAAADGSLAQQATVTAQVNRLLGLQPTKDWMRTVMYTFYGLNLLFNTTNSVDPGKFPEFGIPLLTDERTEAIKFMDNTLWNGNLVDLVTSTTSFVNSNLATTIYKMPVPAGANATTFVQATLPAERMGLLTNAAFMTIAARSDRVSVVARGKNVRRTMTCVPVPQPPPELSAPGGPIESARMALANQTAQQEVATRAAITVCGGCHGHFDQFGLVLANFDNIGRTRTVDELGMPVDTHTVLPPELGGGTLTSAIDLATTFGTSPIFTGCMAQTVLQYALTDIYSAPVKLPSLPGQPFDAACAASDVVTRYGTGKTFSDMVRAVAAAPAFALRTAAP